MAWRGVREGGLNCQNHIRQPTLCPCIARAASCTSRESAGGAMRERLSSSLHAFDSCELGMVSPRT